MPENRESHGVAAIPEIPEDELQIDFARSGGPGGQNVNKVSSKAFLKWNIAESRVLSDGQKAVLAEKLANRINGEGELFLSADTQRSQHQNRADVVSRLQALVAEALTPEKPRTPTKPSRRQKEKRLDEKKRQGRKKQDRKEPKGGW